jgi:hypothetical protein
MIEEIRALPGVYEIILRDEYDPKPVLKALRMAFGQSVGFAALAMGLEDGQLNTWHSVATMVGESPVVEGQAVTVICYDPSYLGYYHAAYSTDHDRPGPLMWSRFAMMENVDPSYVHWQGAAGALADLMERLREDVERHGGRVVIISQDARSTRGIGPWSRAHAWKDVRVRSTLGDAGRRSAHCRFYVDADGVGRVRRVVAWKDEHEGLTGRYLYVAPDDFGSRDPSLRRIGWRGGRRNKKRTPGDNLPSPDIMDGYDL